MKARQRLSAMRAVKVGKRSRSPKAIPWISAFLMVCGPPGGPMNGAPLAGTVNGASRGVPHTHVTQSA